jgi:sugar phosphate permease
MGTFLSRIHYGYLILFFNMLNLSGSLGFSRFSYTMILPEMRDGLGLHNTDMGLIGSIGFIGYLAMGIPGGMLARHFGPRIVIALSLLVSGFSMMLLGTVNSVVSSILLMIIVGMGSAAGNASGFAFASAWFEGRLRGIATGFTLSGAGLGMTAVGILVPQVLSQFQSDAWRWAWFWCGGITIFFGLLCWVFLRNEPNEMGLKPLGSSESSPHEIAASSALDLGKIYKSRDLLQLCGITLTFGFSYIIFGSFFASYTQDELGLTKVQTGDLWSLVGFMSIFSGLVGGRLSDKLGRAWSFTCLLTSQALALLILAMSQAIGSLYLSIALYGLTIWGFPTVMAVSCSNLFGPKNAPAAVGLTIVFFSTGQALGPFVTGVLYDQTDSFQISFVAGALVLIIGMVINWIPFSRAKIS